MAFDPSIYVSFKPKHNGEITVSTELVRKLQRMHAKEFTLYTPEFDPTTNILTFKKDNINGFAQINFKYRHINGFTGIAVREKLGTIADKAMNYQAVVTKEGNFEVYFNKPVAAKRKSNSNELTEVENV